MSQHKSSTSWSSYYADRDIFREYARKADRHKDFFHAIKRLTSSGRLVEIGVGSGTCAVVLHLDYGLWPVGVDIDEQMLNIARRNFARINASLLAERLVQGDGLHLPFAPMSFDVAYSQGLLEHFEDEVIRDFVDEGLRVSRYLAFSVPSCYLITGHLRGDERLLSKHQWERILAGYSLIASEYYYHHEEYFAIITN